MTTADIAIVVTVIALSAFVINAAATKTEEPKTPQQIEESTRMIYNIKKITLEGHEYWHFTESRRGGGICHSESCPCRTKDSK